MEMRVIRERAAARRREFGRERTAWRNRGHDLVADATEIRHAIGIALDLQPVPVHAARLVEVVLHQHAYRLSALELEHRPRDPDRIARRLFAARLHEESVRRLSTDEPIGSLLDQEVDRASV